MTQTSRFASSPAPAPVGSRAARIGLAMAGAVSVVSSILSAALIYLVFVQPAAAAQALAERQPDVLLEALASLVFTALLNLVRGS